MYCFAVYNSFPEFVQTFQICAAIIKLLLFEKKQDTFQLSEFVSFKQFPSMIVRSTSDTLVSGSHVQPRILIRDIYFCFKNKNMFMGTRSSECDR
jgi:hypothetical protein